MRAVPLGPSVAIPAHLVAGLAKLARIGADEVRRRDGATVGGDLGELIADLERIGAVPFPSTRSREQPISAETEIAAEIDGNARMLDTEAAAIRLGVSERRTCQLLASNTLRGLRVGRRWQVDAEDVERLRRERGAAA